MAGDRVSVGTVTSTDPRRSDALRKAEDLIDRELRQLATVGRTGEVTIRIKVRDGLLYNATVGEERSFKLDE